MGFLFEHLDTVESTWFIIFHIIAFLIGLITGYLIWGRQVKRLKGEVGELQNRIKELEKMNLELSNSNDLKEAEVKRLSLDLVAWKEKNHDLEIEKGDLHTRVINLETLEKSLKGSLDDANGRILALSTDFENANTKVGQLTVENQTAQDAIVDLKALLEKLDSEKSALSAKYDTDANDWNLKLGAAHSSLEESNKTSTDLQATIDGLNADLGVKVATIGDLEAALSASKAELGSVTANADLVNSELEELKGQLEALNTGKASLLVQHEAELANFNTQLAAMQASLDEAKLRAAAADEYENELKDLRAQLEELNTGKASLLVQHEAELANLNTQFAAMKASLDETKLRAAAADEYENELGELKGKIAQLKAENNANMELGVKFNEVNAKSEGYLATIGDLEAQINALNSDKEELEVKNGHNIAALNAQIQSLQGSLNNAQNDLNDAMDMVAADEIEIERLKGELLRLKSEGSMAASASAPVETATPSALSAVDTVKELIGSRIPVALAADKDDLKVINGIGAFIEGKLNNLGIYTYEQISLFDGDMIEKVTDAIEFFPGRIQRDDWVGQAKRLAGQGLTDAEKAKVEVRAIMEATMPLASLEDKDDLKVISGVGPFIETKLNALGIYTYEQISLFDSGFISKVTQAIEFFPGRIERDEWVKQAKALFDAKDKKEE